MIAGYMGRLDRISLRLEMQVFLAIKPVSQARDALAAFEIETAVGATSEVLERDVLSSDFDDLIRVAASGTGDYERLYRERICLLPRAAQPSTLLSMSTVKPFTGFHIDTA